MDNEGFTFFSSLSKRPLLILLNSTKQLFNQTCQNNINHLVAWRVFGEKISSQDGKDVSEIYGITN